MRTEELTRAQIQKIIAKKRVAEACNAKKMPAQDKQSAGEDSNIKIQEVENLSEVTEVIAEENTEQTTNAQTNTAEEVEAVANDTDKEQVFYSRNEVVEEVEVVGIETPEPFEGFDY